MNWVVYADGEVLARSGIADPVYAIHTPEVKLELNKAGSFQFSIYPPHPYYNRLFKMKTRIDVVLNGETIFCGRVLYTNVDLRLQKKVYCEGALSYLLDTIQESHDFDPTITQYYDMTVYEFLDRILVKHNKLLIHDPAKILENEEALSHITYNPRKPGPSPTSTDTTSDLHRVLMDSYDPEVEGSVPMWDSLNPTVFAVEDKTKFFKIGTVNADGTSDKFKFEVKGHQKTLDMILETLVDTIGGYMRCTRDPEDGWYVIDWMDNFGNDNFQPIEFGSNLIELEQDESGVEIFTRLYPTGKPSTSSSSSGEEKTSYLVTRILKCDDVLDEEHQREYPDDPTYTGSHLEEDHGIIVRGVEFSDINPGFEYLVQPYQDEHAYAKDAYVLEGSDVFQAKVDMAADDEHPAPENDPNEEYWHRLTAEELEDKTNAMSDAEKLLSIQGQLLKRAKKYIIENCTVLPEQLTLTAIDLRNLAVNYSQMTIGRKIHVYSPPHGIDRSMMCIGISYNLEDPSKNTYTITSKRNGSDAVPRFSQQTRSATKSGRSGAGGGGATDSDGHVNGIGSGGGGGGAATKEDVQQVAAWVQYWAGVETDNKKYYTIIARATGLAVDENGNPQTDAQGNWVWDEIDDPDQPRNTLTSMVDVKADSATMKSELNATWVIVDPPTGANPKQEGWYEVVEVQAKDDPNVHIPTYRKTSDTTVQQGKQYYRKLESTENHVITAGTVETKPGSVLIDAINGDPKYTAVTNIPQGANPKKLRWYETRVVEGVTTYVRTLDTTVVTGKTYYTRQTIDAGSISVLPGDILIEALNAEGTGELKINANVLRVNAGDIKINAQNTMTIGDIITYANNGSIVSTDLLNAGGIALGGALALGSTAYIYKFDGTRVTTLNPVQTISDGEEDEDVEGKINFTYTLFDGSPGTFSFDQAATAFYQAGVAVTMGSLSWTTTDPAMIGSSNVIHASATSAGGGSDSTQKTLTLTPNNGTINLRDGDSSGQPVAKITDANLVAGNIKNDIIIFGIRGTYNPTPSSTNKMKIQAGQEQSDQSFTHGSIILDPTGTYTSVPVTVNTPTATYNSFTHRYTMTAIAKADSTTMDIKTDTTGTEAYTAGVTDTVSKTITSVTLDSVTGMDASTHKGSTYTINFIVHYSNGTQESASVNVPFEIGNYENPTSACTKGHYVITMGGNTNRWLEPTGAYNKGRSRFTDSMQHSKSSSPTQNMTITGYTDGYGYSRGSYTSHPV